MSAVNPTTLQAVGAGMHGGGIYMRVATASGVAQTVQLGPYKMKDPEKVAWVRDAGPKDTAGALTVTSNGSDGKSITFTPASTGELGLLLVGEFEMQ